MKLNKFHYQYNIYDTRFSKKCVLTESSSQDGEIARMADVLLPPVAFVALMLVVRPPLLYFLELQMVLGLPVVDEVVEGVEV